MPRLRQNRGRTRFRAMLTALLLLVGSVVLPEAGQAQEAEATREARDEAADSAQLAQSTEAASGELSGQIRVPESVEAPYGLAELLESAHAIDAALQRRKVDVQKARAETQQAQAARFPDIGGNLTLSYLGNPQEAVTVGTGELTGGQELPIIRDPATGEPFDPGTVNDKFLYADGLAIPPEELTFLEAGDYTRYGATVTVRQPIFTWGRIEKAIRAARHARESAEIQVSKARDEVSVRVISSLYSLRAVEELTENLGEQRRIAETLLANVRNSRQQGAVSEQEVLEQEMRLLEIERGLAEARQQRELLVTRLRSTTGLRELSPGQLRYDALASSVEALPRPEQEALQETVLEQNPSLRLLGKQIEASRLQAERAEAGKPLRPKVAAEAELSAFTPKVPFAQDDWADEGNWQARISLVIDTTFFDGGKKRAEAAAARAEAGGARLDKLNAIQRIQEGLASGYARLVNIGQRIRLQQRHVELAKRQLELTQTARDTGGATENDLLADRLARLGSEAKRLQLALSYIDQYFAALSYMPIRAWPEGVIPADLQR